MDYIKIQRSNSKHLEFERWISICENWLMLYVVMSDIIILISNKNQSIIPRINDSIDAYAIKYVINCHVEYLNSLLKLNIQLSIKCRNISIWCNLTKTLTDGGGIKNLKFNFHSNDRDMKNRRACDD